MHAHRISGMYSNAQNHGFSAGASKEDVDQVIAHCRALLNDPNPIKKLWNNLTCTGIDIFSLVYDSKVIIDHRDRTLTQHFSTLSEFDAFLSDNEIPLPMFVSSD